VIEILTNLVALLAGVGIGAAGYRYYLKRDPSKLEAWAQALKAAGDTIKAKVKE
jgi:hypothetical protein